MKLAILALGIFAIKAAMAQTKVDWGVTPLSMDFHSFTAAPMTAAPKQMEGGKLLTTYENDYPYIVNTRYYMEAEFYGDGSKGLDLAHKTVEAMTDRFGANSSIVRYMKGEWRAELQPRSSLGSSGSWQGSCGAYSAFAMDPVWQKTFANINDGLICSGKPFTKGELKEIVLALYPEPSLSSWKSLGNFYTAIGAKAGELEDANVALSKLGILGSGDFKPQDVIAMAAEAKAQGMNIQMDQDAGRQIWNQPIKSVTDRAGTVKADGYESLSAAELKATNSNGAVLLNYLIDLESSLTTNLIRGEGVSAYKKDQFCKARKLLGLSCDDLGGKLSLTQQVNILTGLKKAAIKSDLVDTKTVYEVETREVVIEYGLENPFASNKPDHTQTEVYRYTIVRDKATRKVVRSQWAPPTRKLKDICKDRDLKDRVATSLVREFDFNSCANGDPEAEFFVGSVPPHNFNRFRATASFSTETGPMEQRAKAKNKQEAYNAFIDMMKNCTSFDGAAQFFRDFEAKTKDNQISASEAASLKSQFDRSKNLLDAEWLKFYFGRKGYIAGLSDFRKSIGL